MDVNVIEDEHVAGNQWKYLFTDGSEAHVTEDFSTSPPTYKKVGVLSDVQVNAIERYSRLKVVG